MNPDDQSPRTIHHRHPRRISPAWKFSHVLAAFGGACGVGGVSPSALAQWSVIIVHPSGSNESQISAGYAGPNPRQVGNAVFGSQRRAGVWSGSAASWVSLHPASATNSSALGAEPGPGPEGTQVGYAFAGGPQQRASLWHGSAASWIDLNPAGATGSIAFAAQGGQQVGYATVSGLTRASLWRGTSSSWINLHPTGFPNGSQAYGVDGGVQVGFAATANGSEHASLWRGSAASWVDLNPSSASRSVAWDVDGPYQVGWVQVNGVHKASLWRGSASTWIDLSPANATTSAAISVDGVWQVGAATVGGVRRASIWNGSAASWTDLSLVLPGSWRDSSAEEVWSDATMLYVGGSGYNNVTRRPEALLWSRRITPPPCPADFNGDGFLDFFDYNDFVTAFEIGGALEADFNGDGFVDFFDYDDFVAAFEAGC